MSPARACALWIAVGVAWAGAATAQEAQPLEAWTRYRKPGSSSGLPQPIDYPLQRGAGLSERAIRELADQDPAGLAASLREQLRSPQRNGEVVFVPGAPTWVGVRAHARERLRLLARLGVVDPAESEPRCLELLREGTDAALEALILNYPESPRVVDARRELAERYFERGAWGAAELAWRAGRTSPPARVRDLGSLRRGALDAAPTGVSLGWIRPSRSAEAPPSAACLSERFALLSRGGLQAIERDTGRLAWQRPLPPGPIRAGASSAVHASGALLTCLELQAGAVEWTADLSQEAAAEVRALCDLPDGWAALVFEAGRYELVGLDLRGATRFRTPLWGGDVGRRSRVALWDGRRPRRQEALVSSGDGQLARVGGSLFVTAEGFVARAHGRSGELLWVRDRAFGAPLLPGYAHPVQLAADGRELWASTAANLLQHLDPLDGAGLPLPAHGDRLILACAPLLTARLSAAGVGVFAGGSRPLAELPLDSLVGPGEVSGRLLLLPSTTGLSWVDWVGGGSGRLELPEVFPRALCVDPQGDVLVWGSGGVALVRVMHGTSPPRAAPRDLPSDLDGLIEALDDADWRLRQRAFLALRSAPDADARLRAARDAPLGADAAADLEQLLALRAVRRAWSALAPDASAEALDRVAFSPN
ncbi:MAG: hypothetical protein KDD82_06140, partial [Planctomycetes bacterium]|nr:hypothetical protein [Planctomycetota bacterium]